MLEESNFVQELDSLALRRWERSAVELAARQRVPDSILGAHRTIALADINRQWALWFIESFGDPGRYIAAASGYEEVFKEVLSGVERRFPTWQSVARKELARTVARAIYSSVRRAREQGRRRSIEFEDRRLLLDLSGSPPRCWICGGAFDEASIERFLGGSDAPIETRPFVDALRPRGMRERDMRIEVDHLEPYSEGGEEDENLALACGFCNRHKGAYTSVYDVKGKPLSGAIDVGGLCSLPQPFWTVRVLGLVGRCEHPDGCESTTKNAELTVCPVSDTGAMNPTNLRVTCYEHDPLWRSRFIARSICETMWQKVRDGL